MNSSPNPYNHHTIAHSWNSMWKAQWGPNSPLGAQRGASPWLQLPSSGRGALEMCANSTTSLWIQGSSINTSVLDPPRSRNPPGTMGWCKGIAWGVLTELINAQSLAWHSLCYIYLLKKNVRNLLIPAHFRCGFYFPQGHRQWQASLRLICVWSHLLKQGGLKECAVRSHWRALWFPW